MISPNALLVTLSERPLRGSPEWKERSGGEKASNERAHNVHRGMQVEDNLKGPGISTSGIAWSHGDMVKLVMTA